jgi:hypothetical protein
MREVFSCSSACWGFGSLDDGGTAYAAESSAHTLTVTSTAQNLSCKSPIPISGAATGNNALQRPVKLKVVNLQSGQVAASGQATVSNGAYSTSLTLPTTAGQGHYTVVATWYNQVAKWGGSFYNDCFSGIGVSQTSSEDCIDAATCAINLAHKVDAGDVLLIFVTGYSFNSGWQAQSVHDSLGNTFKLYQGANWVRSCDSFSDYAFYAVATNGGASDVVTVYYSSEATHSDPVAIDVTGPNLAVYSGNAAECTSSCTGSIATGPTPLKGSYLAAAEAYGDLGGAVVAAKDWVPVPTPAYFMTGEFSSNLGSTSTTFPFVDSPTPTTWGDAGIVVVSV